MVTQFAQEKLSKLNKHLGGGASLGENKDCVESVQEAQLTTLLEQRLEFVQEYSMLSATLVKKFGHVPAAVAFGTPKPLSSIICS
jgi:hypothetical protein